jgi:hypothetical protein
VCEIKIKKFLMVHPAVAAITGGGGGGGGGGYW